MRNNPVLQIFLTIVTVIGIMLIVLWLVKEDLKARRKAKQKRVNTRIVEKGGHLHVIVIDEDSHTFTHHQII